MTYDEMREHPLWQKKKAEILVRDNHTCRSCGKNDITLHAHHTYYLPDTLLWNYPNETLLTLCEICHNTEHLIGKTTRSTLLDLIQNKLSLIHLVAQLCILIEKMPDFADRLRKFLKKEMDTYYKSRQKNTQNGQS